MKQFFTIYKMPLRVRRPPSVVEEMSLPWDGHRSMVPGTGSERPHTVLGEEEFLQGSTKKAQSSVSSYVVSSKGLSSRGTNR